jgi:hypothetical protein
VFGFGRLLVRISRCEYSADTEADEQKKMNARTKDALDESLILSDKLVPCVPIISCLDPKRFLFRIVQNLVSELLVDVGALYKASEAVRKFNKSRLPGTVDLCFHLGCTARHAMVLCSRIYQ